jgi:hypothetical protein
MAIDMSTLKPEERSQWLEWEQGYNKWRNQIFIVFWITYGALYLCRVFPLPFLTLPRNSDGARRNWVRWEPPCFGPTP